MKRLLILFILFLTSSFSEAKTVPSLCKTNHPSDTQIEWECRRLREGETLEGLFSDKWKDVVRFNRVDRRHVYPGISIKVPKRLDNIKDFTPMPRYYQPSESEPKFIVVNLSEQFFGAYEYGHLVFSAPIATGEKGHKTPNGEFRITAFNSKQKYYGYPKSPVLEDAKILFEWVISPFVDDGKFHFLKDGPKMLIIGNAPGSKTNIRH